MSKLLLTGFLIFSAFANAAQYPIRLGNTTVIIDQCKAGEGKHFIHVHQNETTALKAAYAIIKSEGGSLLTLKHPGQRNIVFHLKNQRYEFDPNRIFTDEGIKKTLKQYSTYSPAAHAEVKKLAQQIIALIPPGKVIAVHNNETYSLIDYKPGHPLAREAQSLHINDHHFYRNFYVVTQSEDYKRLKKLNFNSILQATNATDDGSLSVFLAKNAYVNVEAGYDQLSAQIKMLKQA